jgi:hypothetical protein
VVVSEEQLIMAASLTQEANDQHQLSPMLETLEENLQAIGLLEGPEALIGDAGYCTEENLKKAAASGRGSSKRPGVFAPELLIAANASNGRNAGRCPRPEGGSPLT